MNSGSRYMRVSEERRVLRIRLIPFIIAMILLAGLVNAVCAAPTTALHVVKYAADGSTGTQ